MTAPHSAELHRAAPYSAPHRAALCRTAPHRTAPYCTAGARGALHRTASYCTALRRAALPQVRAAPGRSLAVLDIPLLFETGGNSGDVDGVLVVSAPHDVQSARVLSRPGMTREKYASILARQVCECMCVCGWWVL